MGRILGILGLGVGLFLAGAWAFGLFGPSSDGVGSHKQEKKVTPEAQLGSDLYVAESFPRTPRPKPKANAPHVGDRLKFPGVLNPLDQEEIANRTQLAGAILFIGEQVDDAVVAVAGSAPFLAEPYSAQ